jgi:hypothetical protein
MCYEEGDGGCEEESVEIRLRGRPVEADEMICTRVCDSVSHMAIDGPL